MLRVNNYGKIPTGKKIVCLDIGVGANCVYPIIGSKDMAGRSSVPTSIRSPIASANKIIAANPTLQETVQCRLQSNPKDIFYSIIEKDEYIDVSICNPPFHASLAEAQAGTLRKLSNLAQERITTPTRNFGGQNEELRCEGGEGHLCAT